MRINPWSELLIFILCLLFVLTLFNWDKAKIDDAYKICPNTYDGLAEQEIEELETEREFSRELDEQVSRGGHIGTLTMEATAYTHTGNKTATGTWPKPNHTIAVDPNVIPLGSQVLIDGQVYIAEDTGGVIKGEIIDIFMDTKSECLNWGRRTVEIEVIE